MVKVCGKCKVEKNFTEFYKNKRKKDGYQNYCRGCTKKSNACSFQKHKKKRMATSSRYQKGEYSKKYRREWAKKKYRNNEEHRQQVIRNSVAYERRRLDTDPHFRMKHNIRNSLRKFLKGHTKSTTTEKLIGCTWEMLHEQFESQFEEGMTFENYGQWHIDHRIPCAAFTPEEQHICWWHKNLQPMWASENQEKSDRYTEEDKQDLIRKYNEENLSSI